MRFYSSFLFLLPLVDPSGVAAGERVPLESGAARLEVERSERLTFSHSQFEGDLFIASHAESEVRVEVEDYEEALTNYLEYDAEARTLRLKLRGDAMDSDVRVWLPASLNLVLQVMDGDLFVDGMEGGIEVRSYDGRVKIKDADGAVLVESMNGDIEISFANPHPAKPIALTTNDGDINLLLPMGFRATLDLSMLDGHYSLALPENFAVRGPEKTADDRDPWHLERALFELNGGGTRLYLNALDGNVKVNVRK